MLCLSCSFQGTILFERISSIQSWHLIVSLLFTSLPLKTASSWSRSQYTLLSTASRRSLSPRCSSRPWRHSKGSSTSWSFLCSFVFPQLSISRFPHISKFCGRMLLLPHNGCPLPVLWVSSFWFGLFPLYPDTHPYPPIQPSVQAFDVILHLCYPIVLQPSSHVGFYLFHVLAVTINQCVQDSGYILKTIRLCID